MSLLTAVRSENERLVETICSSGASPNDLEDGASAMHFAAGMHSVNDYKITKVLLKFGGDPNTEADEKLTPVHVSVIWGKSKILKLLLKHGGDPFKKDEDNKDAWDYAVKYGRKKCHKVLQDYMDNENVSGTSACSEDELDSVSCKLVPQLELGSGKSQPCTNSSRQSTCSIGSEFNKGFLMHASLPSTSSSGSSFDNSPVHSVEVLKQDSYEEPADKIIYECELPKRPPRRCKSRGSIPSKSSIRFSPPESPEKRMSVKNPAIRSVSNDVTDGLSIAKPMQRMKRSLSAPNARAKYFPEPNSKENSPSLTSKPKKLPFSILGRSPSETWRKLLAKLSPSSFKKKYESTQSNTGNTNHSSVRRQLLTAKDSKSPKNNTPLKNNGELNSPSQIIKNLDTNSKVHKKPDKEKKFSPFKSKSSSNSSSVKGTSIVISPGQTIELSSRKEADIVSQLSMPSSSIKTLVNKQYASQSSQTDTASTHKHVIFDATSPDNCKYIVLERTTPVTCHKTPLPESPIRSQRTLRSHQAKDVSRTESPKIVNSNDLSSSNSSLRLSEADSKSEKSSVCHTEHSASPSAPPKKPPRTYAYPDADTQQLKTPEAKPLVQSDLLVFPEQTSLVRQVMPPIKHRWSSKKVQAELKPSVLQQLTLHIDNDDTINDEILGQPSNDSGISSSRRRKPTGSSVADSEESFHTCPSSRLPDGKVKMEVAEMVSLPIEEDSLLTKVCRMNLGAFDNDINPESLEVMERGITYSDISGSRTSLVLYDHTDEESNITLTEHRLPIREAVERCDVLNVSLDWKTQHRLSVSSNSISCEEKLEIPQKISNLTDDELKDELVKYGEKPGPINGTTRKVYQIRLLKLGECQRATASDNNWDGKKWREGNSKMSFNYLLLDPRTTKNLPARHHLLDSANDGEAFKVFLSAIFYVGKGKKTRPYQHFIETIKNKKTGEKTQQILDIWKSGLGVVSLHVFHNVIPVEAFTREACMVDSLGLKNLTNKMSCNYYGAASAWSSSTKRLVGASLLNKAYQIFLLEGERQIRPSDVRDVQL